MPWRCKWKLKVTIHTHLTAKRDACEWPVSSYVPKKSVRTKAGSANKRVSTLYDHIRCSCQESNTDRAGHVQWFHWFSCPDSRILQQNTQNSLVSFRNVFIYLLWKSSNMFFFFLACQSTISDSLRYVKSEWLLKLRGSVHSRTRKSKEICYYCTWIQEQKILIFTLALKRQSTCMTAYSSFRNPSFISVSIYCRQKRTCSAAEARLQSISGGQSDTGEFLPGVLSFLTWNYKVKIKFMIQITV